MLDIQSNKVSSLMFLVLAATGASLWWAQQTPRVKAQTTSYIAQITNSLFGSSSIDSNSRRPAIESSDPQKYTFFGLPTFPSETVVLASEWYAVGYHEGFKSPVWAVYRLGKAETFPQIEVSPVNPDDRTRAYVSRNDFQRGLIPQPLLPSSALSAHFGREANKDLVYLSNAVPMNPAIAEGPWQRIQELIQHRYAPAFNDLYVVTGPIFESSSPPRLTPLGVSFPQAYFVTLIGDTGEGIVTMSFLIPSDINPSIDVSELLVSIQEIEDRSGVTFLAALDDNIEQRFKESRRKTIW